MSHINGENGITLAEFPPSPLSKFCLTPSVDTICENVTWSVMTGNGKYFVRLFVGDPANDSVNNITINGLKVVKNQLVKRGDEKVFEALVEAKNDLLTLSLACEENWEYAATKLRAVEIIPSKESLEVKNPVTNETKTCGDSFTGGRCESGPDVLHCLFDNPSNTVATNCNGGFMLMKIQNDYKCKDQVGKYKCIKVIMYDYF